MCVCVCVCAKVHKRSLSSEVGASTLPIDPNIHKSSYTQLLYAHIVSSTIVSSTIVEPDFATEVSSTGKVFTAHHLYTEPDLKPPFSRGAISVCILTVSFQRNNYLFVNARNPIGLSWVGCVCGGVCVGGGRRRGNHLFVDNSDHSH